jgi:glycine cleavage system pyridoxal-binding protein P
VGYKSFAHLTEEEIPAGVVKASAMDEGSDNELDEPQETAIKKKLLSSTRNGNDTVINFVGSSTNQELQAYYAHLRSVTENLIKEEHQRSVHENCDNFFKPTLLHSKTSTSSESSI